MNFCVLIHFRVYYYYCVLSAESQMPSRLSWGIGRAATLLKTLLQYFGKSLQVLPTPVSGTTAAP